MLFLEFADRLFRSPSQLQLWSAHHPVRDGSMARCPDTDRLDFYQVQNLCSEGSSALLMKYGTNDS